MWVREDLARRLRRVLRVARKTVTRLAEAGYTDPEDTNFSVRPEKVVAETALLLLAASTVSDDEVAALVGELAQELLPHARGERMLLGAALEPAAAWDYAQAHVFLSRLGYPDAGFDNVLAASDKAQAAYGRERVPHRALERDWLRTGLTAATSNDGLAPFVDLGALMHPIDLLCGSREDVYAFSHAVIYVGDFGIRPTIWPRPPAELCAEAEGALGRCLDEQDYDLAAEVLLTWPTTESAWSAAATFGFRVLAAVEDKAGFLPSHAVQLARLSSLEGDDHTDYLLATNYHTVYVMGLLCSMALQPGKAPPASIPVGNHIRGAADQIARFLRTGDRASPHWVTEFEQLSDVERDALAPLLFSIAVRRCVQARQFASVHELLAICHKLGLSDTPSASQTAELLGRLATVTAVLDDRRDQAAYGQRLEADAPHTSTFTPRQVPGR